MSAQRTDEPPGKPGGSTLPLTRPLTPKFTADVDELRTWTMGGESEYFDKMNRGING